MTTEGTVGRPGGREGGELEARVAEFCEHFVALAGHDLRNPLSAILNSAELIRMIGGDEAERAADRLQRTAGRLSRMLDQMLDVTRIRLGHGVALNASEGDLVEHVRAALDDLRAARPTARLELIAASPEPAWFDPERVTQAIGVLVGNALDHGAEGGPVAVTIEAAEPGWVRLRVDNRGGIPEAALAPALDPLGHGRRKGPRSAGMGLGLYVTRHVAIAHGGGFELAGDGDATRATLRLPRRAPA